MTTYKLYASASPICRIRLPCMCNMKLQVTTSVHTRSNFKLQLLYVHGRKAHCSFIVRSINYQVKTSMYAAIKKQATTSKYAQPSGTLRIFYMCVRLTLRPTLETATSEELASISKPRNSKVATCSEATALTGDGRKSEIAGDGG